MHEQVEGLLKKAVVYIDGEKKYDYKYIREINKLGVILQFTSQGVSWKKLLV